MQRRLSFYLRVISILVALSIQVFFAGISEAQETRTNAMGGIGLYTHDVSNIHTFPGALKNYANMTRIEMPATNSVQTYNFGFHYGTDKTVFAVYLNRPVDVQILGSSYLFLPVDKQSEIYFATGSSGNSFGMGITFGFDSSKEEIEYDSSEPSIAERSSLNFGIKFGYSSKSMDLSGQINLLKATTKDPEFSFEDPLAELSKDGLNFRSVNRFWMPMRHNIDFVPLLFFNLQNTTYEYVSKIEYDNLQIAVGGAFNIPINEKNLVIVAFEALGIDRFQSESKSSSIKLTQTELTFPSLFVGAESQIKSWFTVRFGMNQIYAKRTIEEEGGYEAEKIKTSSFSDEFNLAYGFGLHFADFTLDANFNEGLIFNGPYFISGIEEPVASCLSLSYRF